MSQKSCRRRSIFPRRAGLMVLVLIASTRAARADDAPLYTRPPSDLVVLNAANDSSELEFLPFEDRTPRDRLPATGELVGRLVSAPSEEVAIAYADIAKVELFEERLLSAAKRLAQERRYTEAYDYFARLDRDYPEHPGFTEAFTSAVYSEARAKFDAGEHDHALALLMTLHERSASTPGLSRAVEVIGDAILKERWEDSDFRGVRQTVDAIESQFTGLRLELGKRWLGRIEEGAAGERERAEKLAEAGQTREALRVLSGALALDPDSVATQRLLERLSAGDKTLWVGVWEAAPTGVAPDLDRPAARRQARLLGGRLTTFEAYEPAGGEYRAAVGAVSVDESRLRLTIEAGGAAVESYALARLLLRPAAVATEPLSLLRERVAEVEASGRRLEVTLRGPAFHPEALLSDGLPLSLAGLAPGGWRRVAVPRGSEAAARYERRGGQGEFDAIEEFVFDEVGEAVQALRSRQVHVLAEAPSWELGALEATPGVRVASGRLPTLHLLLFGPDSPLGRRREARRAVCYALARTETLQKLLLSGSERSGFEPLSAPLPRGKSLSDPLRYAYSDSIEPRPFEPRLAALLLAAARSEDAARDEAAQRLTPPLPTTLRLAHPPTPVARLACQAIREQLGAVGFGVELVEATEGQFAAGRVAYDLRYAEVTMSEPLTDVWRLLGPGGMAGRTSAPMREGLLAVNNAPTGKEAVAALRDLHRIAQADVPLVPLWQTVPYFAWLDSLEGPVEDAADLYQSIDEWRVARRGGR